MSDLVEWSFLWEKPEDFVIIVNPVVFPNDDCGLIFDKNTRLVLGIEDDSLLKKLVQRMRQAGVQSVKSSEFHPRPSESTLIVENGLDAGLPRDEIRRQLKALNEHTKKQRHIRYSHMQKTPADTERNEQDHSTQADKGSAGG